MSDMLVDTPPAAAPAEKAKAPTEYHILKLIPATAPGAPDRYELIHENVQAASGPAAVRKVVEGASDKPQTFIPMPSRSWKPVTVTVETKTQLKLT